MKVQQTAKMRESDARSMYTKHAFCEENSSITILVNEFLSCHFDGQMSVELLNW